jgi:hypothetical protein
MLVVSACSNVQTGTPASSPGTEIAATVPPTIPLSTGVTAAPSEAGAIPSLPAVTAQLAKITAPLSVGEFEDVVGCPLGDPEAVIGQFHDLVTADALRTATVRRSDNGSHVFCDIRTSGDNRVKVTADVGIGDPGAIATDLAGYSQTPDDAFGGAFYTRCWAANGSTNCQAVWVKAGLVASLGVYRTAEPTEPLPTLRGALVGMFDNLTTLDPASITVDTTP